MKTRYMSPSILLEDCKGGYTGDPVEFVLIDMSGEAARRFKAAIQGGADEYSSFHPLFYTHRNFAGRFFSFLTSSAAGRV